MEVIRRNTDYALRMLVALARAGEREPQSARRLAATEQVAEQAAAKLLQRLTRAGLVASRAGRNGGFCLARQPAEISLAQVVAAIQGPIVLNRCLAARGHCPRQTHCAVRGRLHDLQEHIANVLERITLAALAVDAGAGAPPAVTRPADT